MRKNSHSCTMARAVGPIVLAVPFIIDNISIILLVDIGFLKEYDVKGLGYQSLKKNSFLFVVM